MNVLLGWHGKLLRDMAKENNFPKSVTKDQIDEQDYNLHRPLKIVLVWEDILQINTSEH